MASQKIPDIVLRHQDVAFQEGHVLRASMLEAMAQAGRDVQQAAYASYADGIIAGLAFARVRGDLVLTPGLIKQTVQTKHGPQALLFPSNEPINLSACVRAAEGDGMLENGTYTFALRPQAPTQANDIETRALRLVLLLPGETLQAGDLLLLRFRGIDGSTLKLPTELAQCIHAAPVDFLDVPYATAMGKATFVPEIFRLLQRTLAKKQKRDVLDTALLLELSATPVVPLATLRWYIDGKHLPPPADDREALLAACADAIKTTLQAPTATAATKPAQKKPHAAPTRESKFNSWD